jgi:c-di-GMP phosphodiesterase
MITQDAGLAYKLVRLANSAFVGARGRVTSVRGALARMGSVNVRRWAMLLSLAGLTDRPQHLLATGLLRARQCELLAAPMPELAAVAAAYRGGGGRGGGAAPPPRHSGQRRGVRS